LEGGEKVVHRQWNSARKGDDVGVVRAKRRRVEGVGIFTAGGAAFYRAEVRRERSGAFNGWC
jgi:hypothetical protein